jgi:hypothetical protein
LPRSGCAPCWPGAWPTSPTAAIAGAVAAT